MSSLPRDLYGFAFYGGLCTTGFSTGSGRVGGVAASAARASRNHDASPPMRSRLIRVGCVRTTDA